MTSENVCLCARSVVAGRKLSAICCLKRMQWPFEARRLAGGGACQVHDIVYQLLAVISQWEQWRDAKQKRYLPYASHGSTRCILVAACRCKGHELGYGICTLQFALSHIGVATAPRKEWDLDSGRATTLQFFLNSGAVVMAAKRTHANFEQRPSRILTSCFVSRDIVAFSWPLLPLVVSSIPNCGSCAPFGCSL